MKKLLAVLLSIMMLAMPLTSMAENSVWSRRQRQMCIRDSSRATKLALTST